MDEERSDRPHMEYAAMYAGKKLMNPAGLQGYALLAVAKAPHRLADIAERAQGAAQIRP